MRWLAVLLVLAITVPVLSCGGGGDGPLIEVNIGDVNVDANGGQQPPAAVVEELISNITSVSLDPDASQELSVMAKFDDGNVVNIALEDLDVQFPPLGIIEIKSNQIVALSPGEVEVILTHVKSRVSITINVKVNGNADQPPNLQLPSVIKVESSINELILKSGESFFPDLKAYYSNGSSRSLYSYEFVISFSKKDVASVPPYQHAWEVVADKVGEVDIVLTHETSGKSVIVKLTVLRALTGIRAAPERVNLDVGQSQSITIDALYSDDSSEPLTESDLNITFKEPGIAHWSEGAVVADAEGYVQMTLEHEESGNTYIIPINVYPIEVVPVIESLSSDPGSLSIKVGQSQAISVIAHYSDGTTESLATDQLSRSFSATGVVQWDNGQIVGEAVGDVELSLIHTASGKSTTISVNVLPALTSLAVEPASLSLEVGQTRTLTITALYSDDSTQQVNNSDISVSYDIAEIAHWDAGTLIADAVGIVKLTFTHMESGKTVDLDVTVIEQTLVEGSIPVETQEIVQEPLPDGLDCSLGEAYMIDKSTTLAKGVYKGLIVGDVYNLSLNGQLEPGTLIRGRPGPDVVFDELDEPHWCYLTLPMPSNTMSCSFIAKTNELYVEATHPNLCTDASAGSFTFSSLEPGGFINEKNKELILSQGVDGSVRMSDTRSASSYFANLLPNASTRTLTVTLFNASADVELVVNASGGGSPTCAAYSRDINGDISCSVTDCDLTRLDITVKAESGLQPLAFVNGGASYLIQVDEVVHGDSCQ